MGFRVIRNDDFLEEGVCYEWPLPPSIIYLGRLCIASRFIFNLWQLRQGVDSLAQWLEHWIFVQATGVQTPPGLWNFQLCFIPSLRFSCRKNLYLHRKSNDPCFQKVSLNRQTTTIVMDVASFFSFLFLFRFRIYLISWNVWMNKHFEIECLCIFLNFVICGQQLLYRWHAAYSRLFYSILLYK